MIYAGSPESTTAESDQVLTSNSQSMRSSNILSLDALTPVKDETINTKAIALAQQPLGSRSLSEPQAETLAPTKLSAIAVLGKHAPTTHHRRSTTTKELFSPAEDGNGTSRSSIAEYRLSQTLTVVETSGIDNTPRYDHLDLLDRTESFKFSPIVGTSIISCISDMQA